MANTSSCPQTQSWSTRYPSVARDDTFVETVSGVEVRDPYRHLESPDSCATSEFVVKQTNLAQEYLRTYPRREALEKKLLAYYDYPRISCPFRPALPSARAGKAVEADFSYFFYNPGLMPQSVLLRARPSELSRALRDPLDLAKTAKPENAFEVFFDPNALSEDGTVALSTFAFSDTARYFAYAISASGSDWLSIHVKDAVTGKTLEDKVEHAKFTSISWTKDELGFFYNSYSPPTPSASTKGDVSGKCDLGTETNINLNARLMFHEIGSTEKDVLVYTDPENPSFMPHLQETDDGKFLVLVVHRSTAPETKLWIARKPCNKKDFPQTEWSKVVDDFEHGEYRLIANDDSVFYFMTNRDAKRYRVVKFDLENQGAGFTDVVGESPDMTLSNAFVADNDKLVLLYMRDVADELHVHSLKDGRHLFCADAPQLGSISPTDVVHREDSSFYFSHTSYTTPGVIYKCDVKTGKCEHIKTITVPALDASKYAVNREKYESQSINGQPPARVPLFLVARKELLNTPQGNTPTLLYGYGGFGIPLKPAFSPALMAFVDHFDGLLAVAGLRGGGEYGDEWHDAGRFFNKQNVFNDFQEAAKYLVSKNYTNAKKLAINGGSNGGLLVAACVNQTPHLFGAAVADVPVTDMLRFHKFTIGHAWTGDYGDPDASEESARNLLSYSPLHNVVGDKKKAYPATMLMTSDHDDRVVPLHSYKLAAELQHTAGPHTDSPLLLNVEQKAGHGAGKPTGKRIEAALNRMSFMGLAFNEAK